jgi:hypothetical protein
MEVNGYQSRYFNYHILTLHVLSVRDMQHDVMALSHLPYDCKLMNAVDYITCRNYREEFLPSVIYSTSSICLLTLYFILLLSFSHFSQ